MLKLSNRKPWILRVSAALDKAGFGEVLKKVLDSENLKNIHRQARAYVVELLFDAHLDVYKQLLLHICLYTAV